MEIANRLKQLRIEANISQAEVAEALDISKTIISQYESGQRIPSLEKLVRLSRFYKTSLDYLVGNVDNKNEYYSE